MIVDDYITLPNRIKNIYDDCKPEEQKYLIKILEELSTMGYSPSYDTLWLQDFKEIPVDVLTFVCDERYLGESNSSGEAVYPYWKQCMEEIFDDFTKYQEVVFTGATRIGKTSTAITCTCYMLYWLMCLRDPQEYFGKKEISKFSIHFFNVTKELASGIAYRECMDTIRSSPWFNDHGKFSRSERNFYYIPEGDKIVINYGSDPVHALGTQTFCLVGDTIVKTQYGDITLKQLKDKYFKVLQYDESQNKVTESDLTTSFQTKYVKETIRITLEDESVIEGTPEHEVMLSDGSYKMMKDLTTDDDLMGVGE